MSELEFRKIDGTDYEEELITLFNSVFGRHSTRDTWEYKHYKNPFQPSGIFGAFDGDRLVGMNAFMPMQYTDGNRVYNIVQSCESAVDPEYRRRGIFSGIILTAEKFYMMEGFDYFIGFPNPENSYGGFLKIGWTTEGNIARLSKLLNPVHAAIHMLIGVGKTAELVETEEFRAITSQQILDTFKTLECARPYLTANFNRWKLERFGYRMAGYYVDGHLRGVVYFRREIKKKLVVLNVAGVYALDQTIRVDQLCYKFVQVQRKLYDIALIWVETHYKNMLLDRGFSAIKSKELPFIAKKINPSAPTLKWEPMYMESDGSIDID